MVVNNNNIPFHPYFSCHCSMKCIELFFEFVQSEFVSIAQYHLLKYSFIFSVFFCCSFSKTHIVYSYLIKYRLFIFLVRSLEKHIQSNENKYFNQMECYLWEMLFVQYFVVFFSSLLSLSKSIVHSTKLINLIWIKHRCLLCHNIISSEFEISITFIQILVETMSIVYIVYATMLASFLLSFKHVFRWKID